MTDQPPDPRPAPENTPSAPASTPRPNRPPDQDWSRVMTVKNFILAFAVALVMIVIALLLSTCFGPAVPPSPEQSSYAPVEKRVQDAFEEGNPYR